MPKMKHYVKLYDTVNISPQAVDLFGNSLQDNYIAAGSSLRVTIAAEIARVLKEYYPKTVVNPEVKATARAGQLKEEPQ